jgi:uncharacterized protein (TIRG00374 family)
MKDSSIIQHSFQGWKIWLAIFLGIAVAGWMLYSSVSAERYVKVADNSGNFSWTDSNGNGIVDTQLTAEFNPSINGNYRQQTFADALQQINWTSHSFLWIIIALLFTIGRDFFYMVRIRLLTHRELSWKSSLHVILLWEFASALSPGVVGGAGVAMFILNREKIALGRSTAIVFVTTMMDNLFYVLMIPFVFLFIDAEQLFPAQTVGQTSVQWIFWIGFAAIFAACLFLFSAIFIVPSLASWFLRNLFSLPVLKRWKEKAVQTGKDIELSSGELRKENFIYWVKVFLSTCCSWVSRYLVINALLHAFLTLGIIDHVVILGKQLVLWLFMLVSPTPGGSGVAEYAFGELLTSFSQSGLLLVALAILWRLISYFPYLFIGVLLLPRWLKKTEN